MNIYADFNSIKYDHPTKGMASIDLTSYGTLASLNFHQVILKQGQVLEFADPDGLSVHAEVYFDQSRKANNRIGWFAKFREADMTQGADLEHNFDTHLCFSCRKDIKPHLDKVGRQYSEVCQFCGTSVLRPLGEE